VGLQVQVLLLEELELLLGEALVVVTAAMAVSVVVAQVDIPVMAALVPY